MSDLIPTIRASSLEEEMKHSYLDYAMSVIIGRALPDVRDGLKPVHRRVLFAMSELNNTHAAAYKKSARIVGDVIGKYHPHGDSAVYDALVRMAQSFSMREILIDGQGNFGSVDGDAPAAMRYTEVRMAKITQELLADLDKNTVDFIPNYDESEREPAVLPTRVPNLLVNGSSGIAVGMATNIPPHNLAEVIDATLALSHDNDASIDTLMQYIKGPDFPTAAEINGVAGIRQAYATGRGSIQLRAISHIEDLQTHSAIIVTELPYQVNKAKLIERIAELVKERKIEGISALRDESDKSGMRVVIELKRGEVAEVILNHLYKHTALQTSFGINMVALVDGQPKLLNLKEALAAFLAHRAEVVTRRTLFELHKAKDRAHILEGLAVALGNLDRLITIIRNAANPSIAKQQLLQQRWQADIVQSMVPTDASDSKPDWLGNDFGLANDNQYRLSDKQAQAILDLRLHRLTGLEQDKIIIEYEDLLKQIINYLDILRNRQTLMQVIRDELHKIKESYHSPRLTRINESYRNLTVEDLIPREDRVITLSMEGYIKSQPLQSYQAQRRGGTGRSATSMKSDDVVSSLFVAHSHDNLLCFTTTGKVYWKKVYEIPSASRQARGKPIINLLPLEDAETVSAVLPVSSYSGEHYVLMATKQGVIKKTPLANFSRPRSNGIIAITLDDADSMIAAKLTNGKNSVMLFSNKGKVNHFQESDVRSMGRTARGVRGIRLEQDAFVLAMLICSPDAAAQVLTATINGYGKRTAIKQFSLRGRGGKGMKSIAQSERNGDVVSALLVDEQDEVMLISDGGTMVRIRASEISSVGRSAQGVRLIRLLQKGKKSEQLVSVARVAERDDNAPKDELQQSMEVSLTENPVNS